MHACVHACVSSVYGLWYSPVRMSPWLMVLTCRKHTLPSNLLLPLTHLPELFPKKLTQALGGAAQWVGRLGGTHGDLGLILGFL